MTLPYEVASKIVGDLDADVSDSLTWHDNLMPAWHQESTMAPRKFMGGNLVSSFRKCFMMALSHALVTA